MARKKAVTPDDVNTLADSLVAELGLPTDATEDLKEDVAEALGAAQDNPADPVDLGSIDLGPIPTKIDVKIFEPDQALPLIEYGQSDLVQALQAEFAEIRQAFLALVARVNLIEDDLRGAGRLQPMAMTASGVAALREQNRYAKVRVIDTYSTTAGSWVAGQELRLDAFPHLEAFVSVGLKVMAVSE